MKQKLSDVERWLRTIRKAAKKDPEAKAWLDQHEHEYLPPVTFNVIHPNHPKHPNNAKKGRL